MKRNWWILTFLLGLGCVAFFGWRIFSQRYEIERTQLQNLVESLKNAPETEGGEGRPTSAAQWQVLSNRLSDRLGKDPSKSDIHEKNREAFIYLQGLAQYKAAATHLDESLGSGDRVADPRPETYLNAMATLETALKNDHFDIPNSKNAESYQRFNEMVGERGLLDGIDLVDRRNRVLTEFGMVVNKKDDANFIKKADPYALSRIGVSVAIRKPNEVTTVEDLGADYKLDVVTKNAELPSRQIDFLMHRLLVHEALEDMHDRLIQRFIEMNRPEYTWQFLSVLVKDKQIGPYVLRNAAGTVYDSRRQHLAALAEWSNSPSDEVLFSVLQESRKNYKKALAEFEEKVRLGVFSARRAKPEIQRIGDSYRRPESTLNRTLYAAKDFDSAAYRDSLDGHYTTDEIDYLVDIEEKRIEKLKTEIAGLKKPRIQAVYEALALINNLGREIQSAGEMRSDLKLKGIDQTAQSLPAGFVIDTFGESKLLPLIETGHNATANSLEAKNAFNRALRDVFLADLLVIKARAARMLNDQTTSQELLGSLKGKRYGRINQAFATVGNALYENFGENAKSPEDEDGDSVASPITDEDDLSYNFKMLKKAITALQERADQRIEGQSDQQALYREYANELRELHGSLEKASFEHAELAYQIMLAKLNHLVGPYRPRVSYRLASRFGRDHRDWVSEMMRYNNGLRPDRPQHPFEVKPLRFDDKGMAIPEAHWGGVPEAGVVVNDNTIPLPNYSGFADAHELRKLILLEKDYRAHYDHVVALYDQFVGSTNIDIDRRARLGRAGAKLDNIAYNLDWKWREANPRPLASDEKDSGYGAFAWVNSTPEELAKDYPYEGVWQERKEANKRRSNGISGAHFNEIDKELGQLRNMTPSMDPDLYAAVQLRTGQLIELYTPEDRRRDNDYSKIEYKGNLARAVREFYSPLLADKSRISDETLVNNRYIPLRLHFGRVKEKLRRWMDSVDTRSQDDLMKLFRGLGETKNSPDKLSEISGIYSQWLTLVSERQPGLMDITDDVYRFNYRLGELADALASLKMGQLKVDSNTSDRKEARDFKATADRFYRIAGKRMLDFVSNFPDQSGEADRQLLIGDAFFKSGDYFFAINAYRSYFDIRKVKDLQSNAKIFYVANRIGKCYMALGVYEGPTLRKAIAEGNEGKIAAEGEISTMTLDGAIPAFTWAREAARQQIRGTGEGRMPNNTIAPVDGLESFVNLARARLESARVKADAAEMETLLEKTIKELDDDFFKNGLFPRGYKGFSSSVYWRDARFVSGVAAIELARAERTKATLDQSAFRKWLNLAELSFRNINDEFLDPVDQEVYRILVNEGKSFEEALEIAGQGGAAAFDDDIFYWTYYYSAEIDRLRATHVDEENALSESVLNSLKSAQGKLEGLVRKLRSVQRRESLVFDESISFPDLARLARYGYADTIYLRARTLRDREERDFSRQAEETTRLDPTATPVFRMSKATQNFYMAAETAYKEAQEYNKNTYLAIFAEVQILNIYRALAKGGPVADRPTFVAESARILNRANTRLNATKDSAFDNAPEGMRRADWEAYFNWYRQFDNTTGS